MNGAELTLAPTGSIYERVDPDWRTQFLAVITNPTVAYMLMLLGIYGLIFEGYNPGAFCPASSAHRTAARAVRVSDSAGQLCGARADRARRGIDDRGVHRPSFGALGIRRHCRIRLRVGDLDGHRRARLRGVDAADRRDRCDGGVCDARFHLARAALAQAARRERRRGAARRRSRPRSRISIAKALCGCTANAGVHAPRARPQRSTAARD